MTQRWKYCLCGVGAGLINGLFGGGGGMLLLPLLLRWLHLEERRAYATCVAVMLPACLLSALTYLQAQPVQPQLLLPLLLGGAAGGFLGGRSYGKVPLGLLRKAFGLFLLYGAARYLL